MLFTIYKLLIISYIHIHRFIIFLAGLIQRSKTIEPAVQPVLNGWTSEPVNRQPRRFDLRSGPNNLAPLPTPSTRESPPPVGGGRAGLAEHLQVQGDGPPLPLPHAPTPIPLSPPRPAPGSRRAQVGRAAATMGVGHRRASCRCHHGS